MVECISIPFHARGALHRTGATDATNVFQAAVDRTSTLSVGRWTFGVSSLSAAQVSSRILDNFPDDQL